MTAESQALDLSKPSLVGAGSREDAEALHFRNNISPSPRRDLYRVSPPLSSSPVSGVDMSGNDSDRSLSRSLSPISPRTVKPIPGPLPSNHVDNNIGHDFTEEDNKHNGFEDKLNRSTGDSNVSTVRPFKMYPMESMSLYNNINAAGNAAAAVAATSSAHHGFSAAAAAAAAAAGMGMGPSLYETPFSPMSLTPLTSHLLQRKRRAENRDAELSKKGLTKPVPEDKKDDCYWERRRKNNEAAKRSRDTRRGKEEEIAMRAAFLEQENLKLRAQVAILKNETAKLHYMLYNRM